MALTTKGIRFNQAIADYVLYELNPHMNNHRTYHRLLQAYPSLHSTITLARARSLFILGVVVSV